MSRFSFDVSASGGAQDEDDRILPLINVVFLLLIFFMIVGSVSQVDPFDIEPPASDARETVGDDAVVVHVDAGGRLSVDGHVLDLAQLASGLSARLGRGGMVHIKADQGVEAIRVVAVLETLRGAGVQQVRLLTVQRPA